MNSNKQIMTSSRHKLERDNSALLIRGILNEVKSRKKENFSGIGVITYNNLQQVPFSPLIDRLPENVFLPIHGIDRIIDLFLNINTTDSNFHDGFHLISREGILTHICCYFSPPIYVSDDVEYTFGGRYRAAHYGSFLTGVDCIGVLGQNYGPTLFSNGIKI
jgi:hypothetical protein